MLACACRRHANGYFQLTAFNDGRRSVFGVAYNTLNFAHAMIDYAIGVFCGVFAHLRQVSPFFGDHCKLSVMCAGPSPASTEALKDKSLV